MSSIGLHREEVGPVSVVAAWHKPGLFDVVSRMDGRQLTRRTYPDADSAIAAAKRQAKRIATSSCAVWRIG